MDQSVPLQSRAWPAWAADAVALLGLLIYLVQAIIFAHTTISNLDEGAYLLKGTLFVGGGYRPFDPGIWTNKAPLAFLIPGFVQFIFGPGLRTGRYLAIFFGVMAVIGTWVAARRLGGKWLAAGAVFVLALSPAVIKMYSNGATQSTIACLLAWSLALALGEKRPTWQLALAGLLAGTMMLVRQNMIPVLPLLGLYALWENGWRGLWLLLPGIIVVAVVHFIYWPDILQLWTWVPLFRIPESVQAEATYSGGGTPIWAPEIDIQSRILSIFQAFRLHFVALAGSIVSLLLWPKLTHWKSRSDFRVGLSLLLLFWGLVYMHSAAAIGKDYCVYCFSPYIAFFNIAGILLLVVSAPSWNWQPSALIQAILVVIFPVIFLGIGLSAFEDIGSSVLQLPAPRVRELRILPGLVTWGDILTNRFNLDINGAKKYGSAAFGLVIGLLITLVVYVVWRRGWRNSLPPVFPAFYASAILVLGLALSPILNGSLGEPDCKTDVIKSNEQIGAYLQKVIPPGSLVYWNGGLSSAPLLYLPDVDIIPAQINDGYAFLGGGNTAELYRFGLWNEEMDAKWKATADFFIVEEVRYPSWRSFFNPEQFLEFERTPAATSCLKETRLRIFQRK